MATFKELVCLANSRKHLGRCVAGIVYGGQEGWIRPVGDREKREVIEEDRKYEDGSEPRVLDIISMPLLQPEPYSFQRENWLLDPGYWWKKIGRIGWDELLALEQRPETLWINGYSTYHGSNDRVPVEQAATLADSLKLIRVDRVTLQVHAPSVSFGNPRRVVQARFRLAGYQYALRVTHPEYEDVYRVRSDGTYDLGESFLTVSLGEPYDGFAYKLVAAIVERAKIESGSEK